MAVKNGFKPGSLDWIEQQYEFHRAKADMYQGVLEDAGIVLHERKQQTARAMFSGALKLERARRPHPTPEERQARADFIVQYVADHPLCQMQEITTAFNQAFQAGLSLDRIRQLVVATGQVERVGSVFKARYRVKQQKPGPAARAKMKTAHPAPWNKGRKMTDAERRAYVKKRRARGTGSKDHPERRRSAGFDGTTAEKARVIASIIQENGGVMTTKDLVKAAREKGITSLTGMVNYMNAGWLRRTRTPKGDSAYRFLKMPPAAPGAEPTVETIE